MSEPMTPPPGQKKKMSPLGWVLIGCGAIAILAILAIGATAFIGGRFLKKQVDKFEENPAIAAAELAIRANPDVELVESDPEAGTITYRVKETGEEVTVNAEDIQEGKWSVTTKEGKATFDTKASASGEGGTLTVTTDKGEETTFTAGANAPKNLPAWLPIYPGGKVEGSFDATTAEGRSAMFSVTTSGTVDEVAEFYESRLKSAGLTVERASYEAAGQRTVTLVGKSDDEKRTVQIGVSNASGQTQASVTFGEKQ